jgi:hypothetical protein
LAYYNHNMNFWSIFNDPAQLAIACLLLFGVACISVAVIMWALDSSKVGPDKVIAGPVPELKPIAPLRKLMASAGTSEAAAAGIATSRWRGQLACAAGWNKGALDQAVAPQEPSLPGRDLPNPHVDTRAIKRAAETNRPLLVGPAEEEKKVETEIRDRLGKFQALHAART